MRGVAALAVLGAAAVVSGLAADSGDRFTFQSGRLSYRKKSTGAERGRELFWLTRNRDGSRTLRTLSMTDDSRFVRDVVYTLGPDARPTDVFVRLQVADRLVGTGYFRVRGGRMDLVTDSADTGHTEQSVEVPARFHVTTHAVMLDGWPFWAYDAKRGGEQLLPVYNTSTRWNGTDGPLGRMETLRTTLVGEEEVTVPAGTFKARRFRFDAEDAKIPTSDVWVTGEDNLLVRYDWGGFDLEYVLVALARTP